jgi:hypothetical protein
MTVVFIGHELTSQPLQVVHIFQVQKPIHGPEAPGLPVS